MKLFECPRCGGRLFFDNLICSCGTSVAFDPDEAGFTERNQTCGNRDVLGCNWVVGGDTGLCRSCEMTTVVPDLQVAGNQERWTKAEQAKRLVLSGLQRWGWFGRFDDGPHPEFHMLSEATVSGAAVVTMGHASGVVTINLAESDAVERVRRREALGEPYRTMVGHFRHEIAHFLFERLVSLDGFGQGFRDLFGEETIDYAAAIQLYYQDGPAPLWENRYITAYASAHPHEDWAESAAHALHLVDMVDSFTAARLSLEGFEGAGYDAYSEESAMRLLNRATDIGIAINHVNRSLGISDLYPFVTPTQVVDKLSFAQNWLKRI